MGFGDGAERIAIEASEGAPPLRQGGGQLSSGTGLGLRGEVVATQKVDADVVEDQRPERDLGTRRIRGIGRDATSVSQHRQVDFEIRGEGDLNDMIDPAGGESAKPNLNIFLSDHDPMRTGSAGQLLLLPLSHGRHDNSAPLSSEMDGTDANGSGGSPM